MKKLRCYGLLWLFANIAAHISAQTPLPMESSKLKREIAIQKLRVQDNVALRQHFAKAGFKEGEDINAESYRGTDSEGEFQVDVVATTLDKNGKKVVVTTVEFRQAGKVTVLTAADDDNGNVVQAQTTGTRVLYASGTASGAATCVLSKIAGSASCQLCRDRLRGCILSSQTLPNKIQCLFRIYASQACGNCAKTSVLAMTGCLFQ